MTKKKNLFFTVMRVLFLFVMGLIVAVIIALSQIDLESIRGNVISMLRTATNMPIEVDGAVSWKFSLKPKIELNKVKIPNADWAKEKYAITAEKVDVVLNLISLLQDSPTIQNVKLYNVVANIEKNDKGEISIKSLDKTKSAVENNEEKNNNKNDIDTLNSAFTANSEKENKEEKVATSVEEKTNVEEQKSETKDENIKEEKEEKNEVKTDLSGPEKYPFKSPNLREMEIKNLVANIFGETYKLTGLQILYTSKGDTRGYTGWIKINRHVLPFIFSYSEYDETRKVYPIKIAFSTGGDALIANIALEGTSKKPIDFVIKGDVPDVAAIGEVLNLKDLPRMKVSISGGYDRDKITFRKSFIIVRGNKLSFSGDVDWHEKILKINANLDSDYINLEKLFPKLYVKHFRHPGRPLTVFKGIPLFGKELLKFNLDLQLNLGKLVVYRDLSIGKIDLNLKLQDGVARLDALASIGGGNLQMASDININDSGRLFIKFAGKGNEIYVGKILSQARVNNVISSLPIDLEFYLEANGTDLSGVMKTLTGSIKAYSVASGYAHSALVANIYGEDFLTSLRHSIKDLFSAEKKYDRIKIICAALNTKIRNGVIESQNGAAVETNAVNIRFAGKVDLGDEDMKVSLLTVPVRGLKLSLSGHVSNSMAFSGSLAEPKWRINKTALAGKVASATGLGLLLAPFTSGIGLVAGTGVGLLAGDVLGNWLADEHPCTTILEHEAPKKEGDPWWMDLPLEDLVKQVINDRNSLE